jgi:hypothetical protein
VTTTKGVLQKVFQYFTEANMYQSNIYGDNISSMKWLRANHAGDPEELAIQVEATLIKLFSRYFEIVECSVSSSIDDEEATYSIEIQLAVGDEAGATELLTEKMTEKMTF